MAGGRATADGTARYQSRFPEYRDAGFYREAREWRVSSLGLGTYLGAPDDTTDLAYSQAVIAAVRGGINLLDTAINYRHQRSERSIGSALEQLAREGFARDELVVCTKAGFLTPGAVPSSLAPDDVAGGMHSMAPAFLADQIERSRANLGLETLDVFYLHNAETQLNFLPREEFDRRIARAFAYLETAAARGDIQYYGTATWHGYRRPHGAPDALSLERLADLARREGGPQNRFRFIQLPFNLAMPEALSQKTQQRGGAPESVLETASALGITVVASASLLQARLSRGLPEALAAVLPGELTDPQRAIQFSRSAPGIASALVGMSSLAHVQENLGIAAHPPASPRAFLRAFTAA